MCGSWPMSGTGAAPGSRGGPARPDRGCQSADHWRVASLTTSAGLSSHCPSAPVVATMAAAFSPRHQAKTLAGECTQTSCAQELHAVARASRTLVRWRLATWAASLAH